MRILKEEKEDGEAQENKMKKRDDRKIVKKKKDDRKPVSYKAGKNCKSLDCFFCKEDKKEGKKK